MIKEYSDELIEFSQPMIFRNAWNDYYDCSISGTYIFIEFYNKLYAVTASHVLGDIEAKDCGFGSFKYYKNSLPLLNKYSIQPSQKYKEDDDFCDLIVVEIDQANMTPDQKFFTKGYIINQLFFDEKIIENEDLFLYGYPSCHQNIDYEERSIFGKLIMLKGTYGGDSEYEKIGIIKNINLGDPNQFESLSGYSGSPVYKMNSNNNGKVLIGILIRGTVESRMGYFIKSDVLKKTLIDISKGKLVK